MTGWDDDASTLHHRAFEVTPEPTSSFRLRATSGPDRDATYVVDGRVAVLVGQSPACQLRLTDKTVSRRHASFDVDGDRLRVRDLGSLNGTFVGAAQIVDAFARAGDVVRLGAPTLVVEPAAPEASEPAEPTTTTTFGELVGASREIRRLFPLFARLAAASIPVLIEGETGTGKEVLARALHDASPRARGPLVVFDCTAVASTLIESELFGHEKGAFTGAQGTRRGVFEQAHGGTLFIDELGDLPVDLQAKLLRAIERSEVRRVGGERVIKCDVRIVAATRRNLEDMVVAGRFRDDLFHRLAVGRVALPPLRERRGEVPVLVAHFCERLGVPPSTIPPHVLAEWETRPWPGNVREVKNAVSREVALGELARLAPEPRADAPLAEPSSPPPPTAPASTSLVDSVLAEMLPFPEARQKLIDAFRDRYVAHMLAAHQGNVQRAAEASGIALRYFQLLRARSR